jgi:site-specific recombinase XerD
MSGTLFLPTTTQAQDTKWRLASIALADAYTDFILSKQAMNCSPGTLVFYKYSAGKFVLWLDANGVTAPDQIGARHVREDLSLLAGQGKADTSLHGAARAIRTLLRFWFAEKYMSELVKFAMPKIAQKRLPVQTAEQLGIVLVACKKPRDKALVLFMADSRLRRQEVIQLTWGDLDMTSGLVVVKRGKGGKARSAVIGITTRRALLGYRRTISNPSSNSPLFPSRNGLPFTGSGLLIIFVRLSQLTGIHVTPHALRRTFVILSLRAGMDVLHLQAMLGHASLGMVQHYAQMIDEDLLQSHKAHSPVDNLARLQ